MQVICFSTSLDTPGREAILGMQTSGAYQSCCVCIHSWSHGLVKKPIYDGYRQFLQAGSRARQRTFRYRGHTYQFKNVEHLLPSRKRNGDFVRECVAVAEMRGEPFMGHKWMPMISNWPGFDWYRLNVPDVMHDVKNFTEMILKVIVGYVAAGCYKAWDRDSKHRAECNMHGIFPSVWDGQSPLPWRLTKADRTTLEQRTKRILWPHYIEP